MGKHFKLIHEKCYKDPRNLTFIWLYTIYRNQASYVTELYLPSDWIKRQIFLFEWGKLIQSIILEGLKLESRETSQFIEHADKQIGETQKECIINKNCGWK